MHDWLLAHQAQPLNEDALRQAATEIGLDAAALLSAMSDPAVAAALAQDIGQGTPVVVNGWVPTLYVNGQWVPRWRREGADILDRIIDAAESQTAPR